MTAYFIELIVEHEDGRPLAFRTVTLRAQGSARAQDLLADWAAEHYPNARLVQDDHPGAGRRLLARVMVPARKEKAA